MKTHPTRWSTLVSAALMLVLVLVGSACANRTVTDSGTTAEQRVYDVRGKIVEISPDRGQMIVAHEEIPGYMMAMTMPFTLKSPLDAELEAGHAVAFRYVVSGSSFHAEGVRRLSPDEAAALVLEEAPEYTAPSAASLYQMDANWVNQDGALTRLNSFTGNPVVLSMIFTNCGYACPMIVADMKQIASKLPEEVAGDVQYVLVSLDPERDTPQAMSQFAAAYGLTSQWTMLRGESDDVRTLAALLGIRYRKQDDGQFAHTSLISVLDESGEIVHQRTGSGTNDAVSAVLVDLLVPTDKAATVLN